MLSSCVDLQEKVLNEGSEAQCVGGGEQPTTQGAGRGEYGNEGSREGAPGPAPGGGAC